MKVDVVIVRRRSQGIAAGTGEFVLLFNPDIGSISCAFLDVEEVFRGD
jgi:hypothetical protein